MASKISVECPACSAKLNIPESNLGKKIKCPKCQEVFAPEAPDEDEFPDAIDDDDFDDELDEGSKKPIQRKKGGGGGSKGSNKKGKPGGPVKVDPTIALVIGGILALVVLGGVGWFLSSYFSSKPAPMFPDANSGQTAAVSVTPPPIATPSTPPNQSPSSTAARPPAASSIPSSPKSTPPATAPQLSPSEKALGLRWMPADTEMILHAKVSEIMGAPLLKGALSNPSVTSVIEQSKKQGFAPSDIESVTLGMGNIVESFSSAMAMGAAINANAMKAPAQPPPSMRPENQRFVAVIKTKKPVDLKQLASVSPGALLKEKNGKQYVDMVATPASPATGVWSPDSNTLVLGTTKELLKTIESGETQTPRKEFASIDHLPQVVIAMVIPEIPSDPKNAGAGLPPQLALMGDSLALYSLQLASIGLSFKGGFDLQVSASSRSDDGSNRLKTDIESKLTEAKAMFDVIQKTAPPLLADLGRILMTNLKVEKQDQVVKISTAVPDSEQAKLEQVPPILMMMAMTGGIPGLGSPGVKPMNDDQSRMAMKLPGETEPVDVVKAEGLPAGMKLTARTGWSAMPTLMTDGTTSITMEILIDVTGDGIEKICGSAGINPKTMKLDGSGKLKKAKQALQFGLEPQKTILHYDASDELQFDHPPGTLRVRLVVDAPPLAATKIESFEGSFKFLTSATTHELKIEEVPRKARRPLADPEFKAGQVKLRRSLTGTNPETLTLSCAKEHFLGQVTGEPGNVISISEMDKDQTVQRLYSVQSDGAFPDDLEIKFKLYMNVEEQTINFNFENIPLPSADSKPELTQEK